MLISSLLTIYILIGLIMMPEMCMASVQNSLMLCIGVVIPSLFPFFICSKILIKNGFARALSRPLGRLMAPLFNVPGWGAFAFLTGTLSGCPMGAKTVTDMLSLKMCSKTQAIRMLCFCNNSGPLFIIGSVATGLLGFREIGAVLFASHILSAIAIGIAMGFYKRKEPVYEALFIKAEKGDSSLGSALSEAVYLMAYVCGFVIFFGVAIEIFKQSGMVDILIRSVKNKSLVSGIIYGMLEMTNGISLMSSLRLTPALLSGISFVLGFGGLSVILQVYGIIKKHKLPLKPFVIAKTFQGVVSAALTYIILGFSKITLPVFAPSLNFGVLNALAFSINIFATFGIIILFLSILYIGCKFLR